MKLILFAIVLVALAVAGIAIKILLKKGGTFAGTCSSNNPLMRDKFGGCKVCGAKPEEVCEKEG